MIPDLGANTDDSAVAIRPVVRGPILCTEGDLTCLPYLQTDYLPLLGTDRLNPTFIRPSRAADVDFEVQAMGGTADLMPRRMVICEQRTSGTTTAKRIVAKRADLGLFKLLKINTDGYDFAILLSATNSLPLGMPIPFFKFHFVIGNPDPSDAVEAVEGWSGLACRSICRGV